MKIAMLSSLLGLLGLYLYRREENMNDKPLTLENVVEDTKKQIEKKIIENTRPVDINSDISDTDDSDYSITSDSEVSDRDIFNDENEDIGA